MDRILFAFGVIVIVIAPIAASFYSDVPVASVERTEQSCNNTTLQNETGPCCWCHDSTVECILESNVGMDKVLSSMLKLNYVHMEKMVFLLNNTRPGYFLVKQPPLKLVLLEHFTDLKDLRIVPSEFQRHYVPLSFTNDV